MRGSATAPPRQSFGYSFCPEASVVIYGQSGTPSRGQLPSTTEWYRCDFRRKLATQPAQGTPAIWIPGFQQIAVPIPSAPGNSLCTTPAALFSLALDARGSVTLPLPISPALSGTFYDRWLVVDFLAKPPGIVTSEGAKVTF